MELIEPINVRYLSQIIASLTDKYLVLAPHSNYNNTNDRDLAPAAPSELHHSKDAKIACFITRKCLHSLECCGVDSMCWKCLKYLC